MFYNNWYTGVHNPLDEVFVGSTVVLIVSKKLIKVH